MDRTFVWFEGRSSTLKVTKTICMLLWCALFWALPFTGGSLAHAAVSGAPEIGINEQLGKPVALNAEFRDEEGNIVTLDSLVDRPTIIAPVYLSCRDVCPMLLAGIAEVIGKLDPEDDYRIVTVSFDELDTPEVAQKTKGNFLQAIGKPFPPERWNYLTGSAQNINALMDSIGFSFIRQGPGNFAHTAVLVVLSPEGKIVRYLYGVSYLPFDLKMALTEAAQGRVGSMGRKVLLYCFSYDPQGRGYVFNVLKVTGTVTLLFVGAFFTYLMISSRKQRKDSDDRGV